MTPNKKRKRKKPVPIDDPPHWLPKGKTIVETKSKSASVAVFSASASFFFSFFTRADIKAKNIGTKHEKGRGFS